MGVIIPQVLTEDRVSGAQVIDGSLRFTGSSYLKRTPGSTGNTTTYTISCWVKRSHLAPDGSGNTNSNSNPIFSAGTNAGSDTDDLQFYKDAGNNNAIRFVAYPGAFRFDLSTSMVFRDVSSWYHILANYDGTTAKIYINGTQVTAFASSTQNGGAGNINTTDQHVIGASCDGSTSVFRGYISQFYFIDGQALDPSYFGYTDALTNTWRPKKLSSSIAFGTNGFYLPFDGSAPIGQDQSGRGNNWTPVNFGGSNTLEKATGALPILNTDGGGKVARVGVRTDSSASSLVLALPLVGIKSDFSNAINSGTSNKAITTTNAVASSAQSNFYGGSFAFDGTGDYLTVTDNVDTRFGTGDFTVEYWIYYNSISGNPTPFDKGYAGSGLSANGWIIQNAAAIWYGGGSAKVTSPYTDVTGKWYHYAFVRNSGTLTMYRDGVSVISGSDSTDYTYAVDLGIGANIRAGAGFSQFQGAINGYIQDVRIYKGLAKYTQNFIPASTDPDILPDTPSGVTYSSNVALVPSTDGAVAFDGSGDELTLSSTSDFTFTTNNYTIECFVYYTATSSGYVYDFRSGDANAPALAISSGTLYAGGAGNNMTVSNVITTGKWYHIALVRNSNTETIYIDGIAYNTQSNANNLAQTALSIGNRYAATFYYHSGFISNLHVVKGTALYTSNFTPPSAPITSVENTKLLCCQSNTSAIAAAVSPPTETWQPSGFTYWTAGMSQNWSQSSSSTSASGDYINVALPTSGKYYWESTLNNPSEFRVFGIQQGADFVAGSYDNTFGFYFNGNVGDPTAVFLTKNESGTSRGDAISHGASAGAAFSNGEKVMWAWDADNDKIWLGRDGTWYASGDPATGANASISGEDLSAASWYYKIGYTNEAGATNTLTLTNVTSTSSTNFDPVANGNTAATNFNPFTVNINTQRGQESGYATFNPLDANSSGTLSNGNLQWASGADAHYSVRSSFSMKTGKWYAEGTVLVNTNSVGSAFGIALRTASLSSYTGDTGSWSYHCNGNKYLNGDGGSSFGTAYGGTLGNVVGLAFDADNGTLDGYLNGVYQGRVVSGLSSNDYFWMVNVYNWTWGINFGQKPFKFPPPAGFQPLALANTPRPSIVRPDQYVGVTTYTGTGAARSINIGFKPDFVWIKQYAGGGTGYHILTDSVRETNSQLYSNDTASEGTQTDRLTSFNRDGFSLGTSVSGGVNNSSISYVAWSWKAGGNSNTFNIDDVGHDTASAAGLTAGTITPTGASVNTKSGFSIVRYTGTGANATVPHGLGRKPSLTIIKNLDDASSWPVFTDIIDGSMDQLYLDTTDAKSDQAGLSALSSTTFSILSGSGSGASTKRYVAYVWAEIPGFSKFGSYIGNSSTDGPMVVTGFKPRWILIKQITSSGDGWYIYDTQRNKYNPTNIYLWANGANEDQTSGNFDILSNGFKLRTTASALNYGTTPYTYIYAAFAETPTFNLYGGQANAR
jgi:hypothetical protein